MSEFVDRLLKLVGLTAGGIGAAGLGLALASNELGLGIIMFIIFFVGGLFVSHAAEIAASIFAIEALLFWILAGMEATMTKGDSFFALIFFLISIVILVFRRRMNNNF